MNAEDTYPCAPARNPFFRGNRLLGGHNGFEFRGVDNIEVSSNNVTLTPTTGCGKRAGCFSPTRIPSASPRTPSAARTTSSPRTRSAPASPRRATGWPRLGSIPRPGGGVSSSSASFVFRSDGVGATFECKLDEGAFEPCSAPKEHRVAGRRCAHLQVRAIDAGGNPDSIAGQPHLDGRHGSRRPSRSLSRRRHHDRDPTPCRRHDTTAPPSAWWSPSQRSFVYVASSSWPPPAEASTRNRREGQGRDSRLGQGVQVDARHQADRAAARPHSG